MNNKEWLEARKKKNGGSEMKDLADIWYENPAEVKIFRDFTMDNLRKFYMKMTEIPLDDPEATKFILDTVDDMTACFLATYELIVEKEIKRKSKSFDKER